MKQCWDADPSKRPDIVTLQEKMVEVNLSYQSKSNESLTQPENNMENYTSSSSKLFTSKLHQFDNHPEPRNATEEEQEAFHSNKSHDFYIPNNIDDFNKSSSKKNITSKISTIFEDSSKKLSNIIKRSSKNDDYKVESRIKKLHINDNDEDEVHNNPNLHSEEQDELELPENHFTTHQHQFQNSKARSIYSSLATNSVKLNIKLNIKERERLVIVLILSLLNIGRYGNGDD
ncbi:hypothetical protein RhiirA4_467175 [Rhizophagus irregularis]|uniref:Serine-threonine/tyrosine-protein kinase catalytic domain-containing protein n=1 Tax=Rhizophagus irregularis TaxID=588596 RepID=A0A2I1GVD7_9GLOM|nr:hypothetical protein RhiirA4_467175 [Rhizophagus irregularis]